MFFFLKRIYQSSKSLQVKQCATALPEVVEENILYLVAGKQSCSSVEVPAKGVFWILGDPIGALSSPENLIKANGDIDLHTLYTELAGHYNWFWVGRDQLATGSSFGGILPVYYHHEINCVCISSSSDFLADRIHAPANDRRYILERLLFHYPLFDATWYQEIKLLPAHSQLSITATHFSVRKNLDFSAYSGTPSKSHNRDLNQLAEQFVSACSDFMPVNRFGISLTGGFDGRTLVGVALKNNRSFFTYSFGAACSSDIQVPARQAKKLGLSHHSIILDENYLKNDADRSIQDFMSLSDYHGNVGRPHYLYSASILSQETSFIVTGNFGSELFRALHLPGMMMTKHLIDVFSSSDRQWKDRLWTEVKSWGQNDFDAELEGLIDDINKYLDESGMTGNARFYRFVYEELFRKYFGPEIIMQNHFLNNRTPYLNYSFVHSLNQTIWSGVHRPLFEENKFKRMIGQLFYAQVLRMSDHRLYRMKTSKGYAPNDVGESWRKPVLFYRYIQQKFNQNEALDDNNVFSVIEHFMQESKLNGIPDSGITFKGLNRDTLINWLSIAYGITKRNANHYASTTY